MGADRLDAQLEPLAQLLLLFILLAVIAGIAFLVINHLARRRRERAHDKLSGSRRMKHTSIDLFAKREGRGEGGSGHRRKRRRSGGSANLSIDILRKTPAPPVNGPAKED